ncbi:hypothetical protein F5I97DRAFT_1806207 [Phlebopus sp. FC_14]|nr:hypothetical protein F5I97DRAFT_1806207 [Phlebopus sp. FC_14]
MSEICTHQDEHRRHLTLKRRTDPVKRVVHSLGSGAPFPDLDSQHVRGPQHAYVSTWAPARRERRLTSSSVQEGSTLDFLNKHQVQGSTRRVDYIHVLRQCLTCDEQKEIFKTLTRHHAKVHPAIGRLSPDRTDSLEGPLQRAEMWTHRLRPRCVSEVLGNERHVQFLRDWLRALHLRESDPEDCPPTNGQNDRRNGTSRVVDPYARGVKRRRVVRAVTKKQRGRKKRRIESEDELDDFVVRSDVDEDSVLCDFAEDQSEDEFAFCQRTLSRIRQREAARSQDRVSAAAASPINADPTLSPPDDAQSDLNISNNLTNTLLITGPPGCGKTAAVYACAEELGWEIFEVYPGIGRRNGTSINHLVGDVGKNHIIKTIHNRLSETSGKAEPRQPEPINIENDGLIDITDTWGQDTGEVPTNKDDDATSPAETLPASKPDVRQSLLLLEEVDILFQEDAGFWTAVVELIRECQRPVVLTCNDARLVPLGDLPLQTILVFEPCPTPLAVTFLQCLSLREGCVIPREDLEVLYESTHTLDQLDAPDAPLYPRTEPIPVRDLRRSISQLQMVCTSAARGSRTTILQGVHEAGRQDRRSKECKWWRQMSNKADVESYVNSHLCRPVLWTAEALSFALSEPSLDDEVGHCVLYMPWQASDTREGLVYVHEDELIAEETMRLARGIQEEMATEGTSISGTSLSSEEREMFRTRVGYQTEMREVLEGVSGEAGGRLMPQGSVFVDYIPWVRYMVEVDDGLERLAGATGRMTRNSLRTKHIRNIELGERARGILTRTRLVGAPRCLAPKAATISGCITSTFTVSSPLHLSPPPCLPRRQPGDTRPSPVISLPPLDHLDQLRRGSLTDPSLHAASASSPASRHLDGDHPPPVLHQMLTVPTAPRPAANYVFGDTSSSEPSSKQMRRILRSPSPERAPNALAATRTSNSTDQPNLDTDKQSPQTTMRQHDDPDHSPRRQSITVGSSSPPYSPRNTSFQNSSDSQLPHGTKRKMSSDREPLASDDIDSYLAGPGIPSPMNMDPDGPAPKRRGSAVDTHRIAQLSIYDHRRHSVHAGSLMSGPGIAGAVAGSPHWWLHDRRDSSPAILPNGSGGYLSAFPADQPHGRPPAPPTSTSMPTFAWSAAQHPDGQSDPNTQNHTRQFESQPLPVPMMPPISFPPDRRMSVPENTPPAVGPTRNVRSRSRPPSRQLRDATQSATPSAAQAAPEDPSAPLPPSTSTLKPPKESGSTPYSRSPELRVSHKLAERKRRKEMKELFDELRDQLPADRGMKASKWEILSKAIDFVANLKQSHQDMARENEMLRHELDSMRQGIPPFAPGGPPHPIVYGQGPVPGPYPAPPPVAIPHPPHPHQPQSQSRPSSSENAYQSSPSHQPPASGPITNGNSSIPTNRVEVPPT